MEFPCTGCGACCRKISNILSTIEQYRSFPVMYEAIKNFPYSVNSDGSCSKLEDNACSVYDNRPLLCNVKELGIESGYDLPAWFELNALSCNALIREEGLPDEYLVGI